MKIESWEEALDHLRERVARTTPAGEEPLSIRPLPGETFYDPTGWRFVLVWFGRVTVTRVGPRGGIEPVYSLTGAQLDYLKALLGGAT